MNRVNIIPCPNSVTYLGGTVSAKSAQKIIRQTPTDGSISSEGYTLRIDEEGVQVSATTEAGFFYARKSLEQLCVNGEIPCVLIKDSPRFGYRGFLLDSARHMQSVDEIKKLVDAAAYFKLNKMHWHLCDDQGFRIECSTYPLLNEKGSWRESSDFGSVHTGERYGGYYTKEQIKEVVNYCAERFIEVIPEIDMPGHTVAMISAYPKLSCRKLQIPVETKQGIFKDILCAGDDYTLEFIYNLLDEIVLLFPSDRFHLGGDEAPKIRWAACPKCRAKMKKLGLKSEAELQCWLTNTVAEHLKKHGKTVTVWNESLMGGTLSPDITAQQWMDAKGLCAVWANRGNKIICSDFYHYYCDYPYAMTPLKKTYGFSPIHKNIAKVMEKNVLGVEAAIWTEYIDNFSQLCYMTFPRFAAVAENGWTKPERLNEQLFEKNFVTLLPQLEKLGIRPADKSEWNPTTKDRVKGLLGFYKGKVDLSTIKNSLDTQKK